MNLEDLLFLLNNNKNTIVNLEVRLTEAKLSRHNGLGVIHLPKGVIVFKGHKFEEKCDVITLQVNLVGGNFKVTQLKMHVLPKIDGAEGRDGLGRTTVEYFNQVDDWCRLYKTEEEFHSYLFDTSI